MTTTDAPVFQETACLTSRGWWRGTGFGTTRWRESADADGLATEKEEAATLSLITFTICRDVWHQDCNETEMIGGENFEGEGMFHTAGLSHSECSPASRSESEKLALDIYTRVS